MDCSKWNGLMSYDTYGAPIQFSFPDGEPTKRSLLGAYLGIIVSMLTLIFLIQNFLILYNYGDSVFTHTTVYGAFDSDYGYSEKEGFQIAFGLRTKQPKVANARGGINVMESLRILEFKLADYDGEYEVKPCTEEEL